MSITLPRGFRKIKELGKGGFGKVYLVKNDNGKQYALKQQRNDGMSLEDIKMQIELRKKIKSDDLLNIKAYYTTNTHIYVIYEYIDGVTLHKYIKCLYETGYTVPKRVVKEFMHRMLILLVQMHDKNIVHRDIKPRNIMFTDNRLVLIDLDFFCVTDIDHEYPPSYKCRGTYGTIDYRAPELYYQKERTGEVLKAADIWALGVTFFAMVSGKKFLQKYRQLDDKEIIQAVIHKSKDEVPLYPDKEINEIISKMLTYDYKKRPTAQELLNIYF